MQKQLKYELQNHLRGDGEKRERNTLQTVAYYLSRSQSTSNKTEDTKQYKTEEIEYLMPLLEKQALWLNEPSQTNYLTEGAEQKVYLMSDLKSVIKLNAGIFYLSWLDYLHSLLLHNFFFPHTTYEFLGFSKTKEGICAVVRQDYIKATEATQANLIKDFLESNGFMNKRNQDYENHALGIILEDLHEANVLTNEGTLFFIDTIFYLKDDFWE